MRRLFFLSIMALSIYSYSVFACTNFIVTKGASVDGSVMITYNADAGGFMEPFYYEAAKDHKPGEMLDIFDWDTGKFLGKIKQVKHTYRVVGHMNEYQVSLGETTFGGRHELEDSTAIIDYGSLMKLALQRAKTAREAIRVMGDLVAEYGYYSEGESFSVADPNEAWILEMIGKGGKEKGAIWVARRIPDGYVAAHANQARIREVLFDDKENCMYAPDIVTFAEKMGYYKKADGKFSFVDAYCPPDPGALLFCEGRVWRLFSRAAPSQNFSDDYFRAVKGAEPYPLYIKPDKKLSVKDVINFMRDHFEGTEYDLTKGVAAGPFGCPVRWKGLTWKLDGDTNTTYAWERPISTQQTAFAFVSQMRSWLPREVGGLFWYGVDDNYTNVYVPLYSCLTEPPKPFAGYSISKFSLNSGFWVFNLVANLAYTKYSYVIKDIQPVQAELENGFFERQPEIEKKALELNKKNPKEMVKFLTKYSLNQAENTVNRWRELWEFLVMKYNDGYINDVKSNNGRSPKSSGYSQDFLKAVIKDKPDYYEVKWRDKSSEKSKANNEIKAIGKSVGTEPAGRVTGIGGFFFKSKDPVKIKEWYKTHLGLNTDQYGAKFEWYESDDNTKKGLTQWSPFKDTTSYFNPSTKEFMMNFRVANLETLVRELRRDGVTILDNIETYDKYGKFIHIMDIEGNKVELWEPPVEDIKSSK